MVPLTFSKATAQVFIECLDKQRPIHPPDGLWTADNMLQLAGACLCVVLSQGSRWHKAQGVDVSQFPEEQQEAINASLIPETSAAIDWIAERCFDAIDDNYDDQFEPEHSLLVSVDDGEKNFAPVFGFKSKEGE